MTRIHADLGVAELGAIVSEALKDAGLEAVLSGGSVVTIYAGNQWESFDLDFVVARVDRERIKKALIGLGFKSESVRQYSHPNHTHWIDISAAPVALGDEFVERWDSLQTAEGTLEILTPTQCVKDRLAGFYHAYDRQSLDQAVAVCVAKDVSLQEIQSWSENERPAPEKLREFVEAVRRERSARAESRPR